MPRLTAPLILALAASSAVLPAASQSTPAAPAEPAKPAPACPATLRHTMPRLQDEAPQDLCQYRGQVLLVVNTASYCGFTGQYEGLEALHARYKTQGFAVLGFPSNDFAQETGSNAQIADFCSNTFGVRFPMFAKSSVKGGGASPFYRELAAQAGRGAALELPQVPARQERQGGGELRQFRRPGRPKNRPRGRAAAEAFSLNCNVFRCHIPNNGKLTFFDVFGASNAGTLPDWH